MDGTGDLFTDLVGAIADTFETITVEYPTDSSLAYSEFADIISTCAPTSDSFMLVAESFSVPLAIQWAATSPANLKGLVLCAGFVTSPIQSWLRPICTIFVPILFRMPLPKIIVNFFLVGSNASPPLVDAVRAAVSSVQPKVLSARLRNVLDCDSRADLSRVTVPILFIQPSQDRLIGPAKLEEMRRLKPQAAVEMMVGPHLLFQREPQQSAAVITRFAHQVQ
jgi:pimeloyl-[acyl-carrier protein] methyl ester esterase